MKYLSPINLCPWVLVEPQMLYDGLNVTENLPTLLYPLWCALYSKRTGHSQRYQDDHGSGTLCDYSKLVDICNKSKQTKFEMSILRQLWGFFAINKAETNKLSKIELLLLKIRRRKKSYYCLYISQTIWISYEAQLSLILKLRTYTF